MTRKQLLSRYLELTTAAKQIHQEIVELSSKMREQEDVYSTERIQTYPKDSNTSRVN